MEPLNNSADLNTLLDLNGITYQVDEAGKFWVKFEAKPTELTPQRPQGVKYSFTLHDEECQRMLGFDNAHAVIEGTGPGARTRIRFDHLHAGEQVRFYNYTSANALVTDFWKEVDTFLKIWGEQ